MISELAYGFSLYSCYFLLFYILRATACNAIARYVIAISSVRLSVCPSVHHMGDQSKTVQAKITKASLSASWWTLVLGSVKPFHKFERGHPERGC